MTFVPNLKGLVKSSAELKEPEVGDIQGHLPPWVRGTYLRNGPGKWDLSTDFNMNHVFDGFAILSKFQIEKDRALLTTKYLESDDYQKAVRVGRPVHLGFGTKSYPDPNKSLFSRFVSNLVPQETSDNCNTGIYKIGQDVFTGVDGTFFYQVDPVNLRTLEKLDGHKLFGLNVVSPKPNTDPQTGDVYNVGSFVSASGVKHGVVRIPDGFSSAKDAFKKSKIVASWPSRWSTSCHYTHSFGLTKNYYVIVDQPFLAGLTSIAANAVKGKCMIELFEWHPKEKNRFFLVDRASGKLLRTEYISAETFFFFHIVNCYEDNNHMIVDVMAYDDTSNFQSMYIDQLRQNLIDDTKACQARRYVIPISDDYKKFEDDGRNLNQLSASAHCNTAGIASAIREGHQIILRPHLLINETAVEGPTINKKFLGKKYKYFYGNPSFHMNFMNNLAKFNADDGEMLLWKGTSSQHPGEPLFIPNPNLSDEDDGIILSAITETNEELNLPSFLLFLDAKTFEELARIEFRTRIPLGVDGIFIPAPTSK